MRYADAMDVASVWIGTSVETVMEFGTGSKEDEVLEYVGKWGTGGTRDMDQTK